MRALWFFHWRRHFVTSGQVKHSSGIEEPFGRLLRYPKEREQRAASFSSDFLVFFPIPLSKAMSVLMLFSESFSISWNPTSATCEKQWGQASYVSSKPPPLITVSLIGSPNGFPQLGYRQTISCFLDFVESEPRAWLSLLLGLCIESTFSENANCNT